MAIPDETPERAFSWLRESNPELQSYRKPSTEVILRLTLNRYRPFRYMM